MAVSGSRDFLLVHGGFHGGWCWRGVADLLRATGHRVFTPTLTGLGERAHLFTRDVGYETWYDDLRGVILHEELNDIILVGHSLGGGPVSVVADRMPEAISHLVYLDAVLTEPGTSILDTMPPESAAARRRMAEEDGSGLMAPPPGSLFGLTKPEHIAWVERRITPQPFTAYTQPWKLRGPLGNGLPVTYVECTEPQYQAVAAARELAANQHTWSYRHLACSHEAMIVASRETADLLEKLATSPD